MVTVCLGLGIGLGSGLGKLGLGEMGLGEMGQNRLSDFSQTAFNWGTESFRKFISLLVHQLPFYQYM